MHRQAGFGLLSLLGALVLIGLLYVAYLGMSSPGGETTNPATALAQRDLSRVAACRMNRQAAAKALVTWSVTHPGREGTIDDLRRLKGFLECPEGGHFRIEEGRIVCHRHPDP